MDKHDVFTLTGLEPRPAVTRKALGAVEDDLGARIPEDYRAFLLSSNGLEGFVGPEAYLSLYQAQQLPELQYDPNIVTGLVVIGSDGGGEAFGYIWQKDGTVIYVRVPFLGDGDSSMDRISSTFMGLIERLRAGEFP